MMNMLIFVIAIISFVCCIIFPVIFLAYAVLNDTKSIAVWVFAMLYWAIAVIIWGWILNCEIILHVNN